MGGAAARERVRCCNCRGVRGQIIFPRRIVNTARCLARIKSAAGHSPIMHLCILCITPNGALFRMHIYEREEIAAAGCFRILHGRTPTCGHSSDYWKKAQGCNHILLFLLLIMMNACAHYFCAHSFRRGWWVTSFVVCVWVCCWSCDRRQNVARVRRKSGNCLFGLAEVMRLIMNDKNE